MRSRTASCSSQWIISTAASGGAWVSSSRLQVDFPADVGIKAAQGLARMAEIDLHPLTGSCLESWEWGDYADAAFILRVGRVGVFRLLEGVPDECE